MDRANRQIYNWLITGCLLISLILVVGGITRLTQSGLSIVSWDPIMGIIPPLTEAQWQESFEMYKQSPEFNFYNSDFTLSNYKSIFFWEYLHRLLGRVVGLIFLIPCIYFWAKGYFNSQLKKTVAIIFIIGAFQGLLGWLMVLSGLKDIPHVSHFRLAAHFLTAIILMLYIFWSALKLKNVDRITSPKYLNYLWFFIILIFLQVIYGAFVAGLKAGLLYPTFPKMGNHWFPSELSFAYEQDGLYSLIKSGVWVHFLHRCIALVILLNYVYLYFIFKTTPLNAHQKASFQLVGSILLLQIILGILTLIYSVPIFLGVLHQSVAVILLFATTLLIFNFHYKMHTHD